MATMSAARHRFRHHRTGAWVAFFFALFAPPAVAASPAAAALPLWRISDGAGHVLYLAGSMHALTAADYPLPKTFAEAFGESDRLVEELDLAKVTPAVAAGAALQLGTLAKGTLADAMGGEWQEAKHLAAKAGIDLERYSSLKPWLAGIEVADVILIRTGYEPALGLDIHFAQLAAKRKMPVTGLETMRQQLEFLDGLEPALQRRFLVQTLREAPRASTELAALHAAWRNGDMHALEAIEQHDFKGFPALRRRLLGDRNRNWLPQLKSCLASGNTCFVAVGVEHMVGPDGLLALLRNAGYKVTQMTRRGSG